MGYPGKRKTKTEKAIAEAERQAKLLALPHASDRDGRCAAGVSL